MTLASVVIPTWNGLPLLRPCLEAMRRQTHTDLEVIVVDDGSTDGTAPFLRGLGSAVAPVILSSNRGFAVAMNAGFAAAHGEVVVALNNDTVADPSFVAELVEGSQRGFDMVASRVVLSEGDRIDSAGIEVLRDGGSRERLRNVPETDERVGQSVEVFGPSAAAALYTRRMLDRVGGFDESFEAYYEDVDLAWRGRLAGLRCAYNPRARVRHVHSATWGRFSRRKLFLLERNRYWTLWKDYPVSAWPMAGAHHLLSAASMVRGGYLDSGSQDELRAIGARTLARIALAGSAAAWKRFPSLMRERRRIRASVTVRESELNRWLET
jgi:GT2 family glycosyltransferase